MLWLQYVIVLICVALAAVYLVRTFARSATTSCASKGCSRATQNAATTVKRTPIVQIGQQSSHGPPPRSTHSSPDDSSNAHS